MNCHRRRVRVGHVVAALALGVMAAACGDGQGPVLLRQVRARQLAAELLVQFTAAADAGNRAVMADTDELSAAFSHEAGLAKEVVRRGVDELKPLLAGLGESEESQRLDEFGGLYAEYEVLDRGILELAVENSNLKAQRLSFGPIREAADSFRDALAQVAASSPPEDIWRVRALVAEAVSALRGIQVLEARHIAEPEDATMTRIEQEMAASGADARSALHVLGDVVPEAARERLAAATAALERFLGLHAELVALSRRNTNVRSLSLSLGRKRLLRAACEESLRAMRDVLEQRGSGATR